MPVKKPSVSLLDPSGGTPLQVFSSLMKAEPAKKKGNKLQEGRTAEDFKKSEEGEPSLVKSILNVMGNQDKTSIQRLAFETDPSQNNKYQAVYRIKPRGIPDAMLKQAMIKDDLVAAIIRVRETQLGAFGRPRPTRFDSGFMIEPRVGVIDRLSSEQKAELESRIERAEALLATCGSNEGVKKRDRMSFSQYLLMSARHAVGLGRIATEALYVTDVTTGDRKFHSFRPTDTGTIFPATPYRSAAAAVRKQALTLLEQLKNKKFIPEKFTEDEYAWIQVIDGRVMQAFTDEEMLVHNFFPVVDVEMDGFPVTPIDTMISAITTHINITKHNQIYFQTGRATRGMLVFKSDEVDESVLNRIKQQFNASINSVDNAWRMPVFSVGSSDEISWEAIDNSSRDAEFQYLTDMNARVIFAAFQISPDEVPGWSYLSRGTNNQGLSESNNEYRLEAARDVGIRPLLAQFEEFINTSLFPLIDATLAKICRVKLVGLDAETEEKESVRLQQDSPVHGTMDWIMGKVEKKPFGREWGGEFPLNPQYQAILDKYYTVGQIKEHFMGIVGASKDPQWNYVRDPFYFQNLQLQMQMQQAQAQAEQAKQQAQQGGAGGGQGGQGAPGGAGGGAPPQGPSDGGQDQQEASGVASGTADQSGGEQEAPGTDLTRSIDQAIAVLTKSESQLPTSKRVLLAQHRKTMDKFRRGLEDDIRLATREILDIAGKHSAPRVGA